MSKKKMPTEIVEPLIDGLEQVIFPNKAKTFGGKIIRLAYKVASLFLKKKI